MPVNKILHPTDFSQHAQAALRKATALARQRDAMLLIVHVKEPPATFSDAGFSGLPIADEESTLRRMLSEVKPTEPDVGYAQKLLRGHVANQIVRLAEKEGASLIVMGTHGRTGLSRLLMGSVAEAVIREAPCPVLTVKRPRIRTKSTCPA